MLIMRREEQGHLISHPFLSLSGIVFHLDDIEARRQDNESTTVRLGIEMMELLTSAYRKAYRIRLIMAVYRKRITEDNSTRYSVKME